MEQVLKKKNNSDLLCLSIIFIVGVVAHYILADFSKSIDTYPDELRYYMIARSLYHGQGLTIRGIDTNFQKLAYSMLLVPLFAIRNSILRIKLISLLNCIVMMFSIIPAWYIGKELKLKRIARYGIVFLIVIWPDLMFSMAFMSEILYWPIFLSFIYVWLLNERKMSNKLAVLEGLICYLGYMTKEIFLALFLAYFAFEILYPIIDYFINKKNSDKKIREYYGKNRILKLGIFCFAFFACYLLLKFTVFKGLGNSYNQMSLDAILKPYNFAYMLYAFFYYIAAVLIAALVIPAVFPIIHFKNIGEKPRKLFCMILLFFLIAVATIAYTVSVREDLGKIIPRLHFRYLGPGFIVLILVFFCVLQFIDLNEQQKKKRLSLEVIIAVLAYISFVFKGVLAMTVDEYTLEWYRRVNALFPNLLLNNGEAKIIYTGVIINNLLIVIGVLGFYYIFTKWKRKWAVTYFMVGVIVISTVNDLSASVVIQKYYNQDPTVVNEVVAIDNYFNGLDGKPSILYLTDNGKIGKINKLNKCMDTYMDDIENLYYIDESLITSMNAGDTLDVSRTEFIEPVWGNIYPEVKNVDYIILEKNTSLGKNQLANVNLIPEISGSYFSVYRNLDSSKISLEINPESCYKGDDFYINFYGDHYNASNYVVSGVSWKEDCFSWTDGDYFEISVPVIGNYNQVKIDIDIGGTFNGEKSYVISQSGKTIQEGSFIGSSKISFVANTKDGFIKFIFKTPDSEIVNEVNINSTDTRKAAFQLKTIKISEVE